MEKLNKTTAEDYAEFKKDKDLKKVNSDVPFIKGAELVDISLKARGPKEDHMFAGSEYYRKKIRRGLSFLINTSQKKVELARRGLEKFFDLLHEYLNKLNGDSSALKGLDKDDKNLYSAIFQDVEAAFASGCKVVVYKTEKANGENAQISYSETCDAWVASSKNVSIMVRTADDIEAYRKMPVNRYDFAVLIADTWFKMIKDFNEDKIKEIKDTLKDKTIIGEYCGNPKYQHMVQYEEITIFFYALVEKEGLVTCLPVETAHAFFDKVGLPKVKINKKGTYSTPKELTDALEELYKEVSSNPIEVDAEGAVLYLQSTEGPQPDKVLSLSKLKTLEYRFYRKLREKLKSMMLNLNDPDNVLKKYNKEIAELASRYDPPKPMESYSELAKIAMNFVYYNLTVARKLGIGSRYIDFLNVIKKCQEEKRAAEVSDFQKLLENPVSDSEDEKEGGEDTEEKKNNEESKVETKVGGKNVVLITPPFYMDQKTKEEILANFNLPKFEIDFNETDPIEENRLTLLHKFPKLTNSALSRNTFFLIVGFESQNYTFNTCFDKISELAKDTTGKNYTNIELEYLGSKELNKFLGFLWEKSKTFHKSVIQVAPDNYLIVKDFDKTSTINQHIQKGFDSLKPSKVKIIKSEALKETSESTKKPKIIVFIPLGIPGMGKTTFFNVLHKVLTEFKIPYSTISNDEIRRVVMDNIKTANPGYNSDQVFANSNKPTIEKFNNDVDEAIEKANQHKGHYAIILDKNHGPFVLKNIANSFKKLNNDAIKICYVIPHCTTPFTDNEATYSFSANFLLTSITRAISRKNHLTLGGSDPFVAGIIINFFKSFKNFKSNDEDLKAVGGDYVLRIPYTLENDETDESIPEEVKEQIRRVLLAEDKKNEEAEKLLAIIEEKKLEFKNPSLEVVYNTTLENLKLIFDI